MISVEKKDIRTKTTIITKALIQQVFALRD
jgi:hypothetical protein